MSQEIHDVLKELVLKSTGKEPLIDDVECKIRTGEKKCIGCPSELSCSQLIMLQLFLYKVGLYSPKDFKDYLEQEKYRNSGITKILEAKTVTDLKELTKELI